MIAPAIGITFHGLVAMFEAQPGAMKRSLISLEFLLSSFWVGDLPMAWTCRQPSPRP